MNWRQAVDETLSDWRRIRASIDAHDSVQLLTDINAVCALCEKTDEERLEGETRCDRCLVARQFGGCAELNGRMSERVAERDWDGLRSLVDEYIHHLEDVEFDPSAK